MIPFYNLSLQEVYCPDPVLLRPADSLFLKDHHPLQAATCLTLPCFFLGVKNTNLTSSGGMDNPRLHREPEEEVEKSKIGNKAGGEDKKLFVSNSF